MPTKKSSIATRAAKDAKKRPKSAKKHPKSAKAPRNLEDAGRASARHRAKNKLTKDNAHLPKDERDKVVKEGVNEATATYKYKPREKKEGGKAEKGKKKKKKKTGDDENDKSEFKSKGEDEERSPGPKGNGFGPGPLNSASTHFTVQSFQTRPTLSSSQFELDRFHGLPNLPVTPYFYGADEGSPGPKGNGFGPGPLNSASTHFTVQSFQTRPMLSSSQFELDRFNGLPYLPGTPYFDGATPEDLLNIDPVLRYL